MNLHLLLVLWLVSSGVCLILLAIILLRPALWASWVDKENNYWVRRGWFSRQFAEKAKKLETGPAIKLVLAANIILGLVIVLLILRSSPPRHFKALLPPKPKPDPQSRPAH